MNQTQSTHPSGGSKPKPGGKTCGFCLGAANLPKGVACGYSEGAGFIVLTELPWPRLPLLPVAPHPPLRRRPRALARRVLGRPGCRCALALSTVSQTQQRPSALRRCSGGDDSSTASASCVRGAGPCTRLCPHSSSARHVPPPRSAAAEAGAARRRGGGDSSRRHRQGGVPVHSHWGLPSRPSAGHQQRQKKARGDGVGRRPKTPPDDQDERSPARATAAAVVVSVTEALERGRGNGTRETAQELQHGCGEDCWRSASLAALHARPRALH